MSADSSDDVDFPSAIEAARSVREGSLASRDLVDACLARIEAREGTVKAWHYLDPEKARAAADALDASARAGALAGVPVAVKDIFDTADMPTAYGSPIYKGSTPRADAACVSALRSAGAVIMGKSATTEFAAFTPTDTANPHDPGHTPGGSSSGSAAAVADGMVPLAIGTQTAGSIVRPASYCGVAGFKPTYGAIDRTGLKPFAETLDTIGVFARNVADTALLAGVLAGWDALTAVPKPRVPMTVKVVRAPEWDAASPEADAAVSAAGKAFEALGARVSDLAMPEGFEDLNRLQDLIQITEGRRALSHERARFENRLSEGLRAGFARAARIPFTDYIAARRQQEAWIRRFEDLLAPGDIVLTASTPGEAPKGLAGTGDPVFCRAWTFLHCPCMSLPCGTGANGLPLGIQLVGRRWEDAALLAAARAFEARPA